MFTVELTRQIEIAHKLEDTQWLITKACANPDGHGHSYQIKVSASFKNLLPNGMACDFSVIKNVINRYDHQNLNKIFEPTTAEVFAHRLYDEVSDALIDYGTMPFDIKVSLSETGKNWVTYQA